MSLLFRSWRQWWSPPAPPRTRHDRVIDLVVAAVPPGAAFRPREVYALLNDRLGLSHRAFCTHLWQEAERPSPRIERLGHGVYRAR